MFLRISLASLAVAVATCSGVSAAELHTVKIRSSKDGALQPAQLFVPDDVDGPVALLVLLHTWSSDYQQTGFIEPCLAACRKRGWALVAPNFRGPNRRPEACASELAVQDVLDAVAHLKRVARIDPRRVYLAGSSGGGHMALIMAGRAPEVWAGVSAWAPITDLAAWHAESVARRQKYARDIELSCGGKPGDSPEVDREYRRRSPLTHLAGAKGVPIDVNAGIDDGHTGSVPISHSLRAFNRLAAANGESDRRLSDAQIEAMTSGRKDPDELAGEAVDEPDRAHAVLFRRSAGPARITIFAGGHEGDMPTAIRWLARQRRATAQR